jgi:manganese/zinc/iron transport system substrate-binding protein
MRLARSLLLWALILTLAGCGGDSAESSRSAQGGPAKLNIVATTGQVGDLVAMVGGERVEVTALMGPGVDPHLYKASAGDVDRLGRAQAIFYNGLHLEAKMAEVLERLGSRQPVFAVADGVAAEHLVTAEGYTDVHDPHIWFDVALWKQALDKVRDSLIEVDPEHAAVYRENATTYTAALTELDTWVKESISSIPADQRVLVTAHDAFEYLGRAYGLEVRGLQGISTATEAGTADVQDLAAFIAERRIPALFVESSVSPRAIAAVQAAVRARGHEVVIGGELFSDAMGDAGTPEGTYLGMFRHNVNTLVKALTGGVADEN